jgi:hypothetical protein
MLSWASIGGMGMLAELFGAAARGELRHAGLRGGLTRIGVGGLVFAHVIAAPLLISMRSRGIAEVRAALDRADRNIPRTPDVREKTIVYVNPPADPFAAYIPIHREALGVPRPMRQRWLTTGATPIEIQTIDDRTLEVRPEGGFMQMPSERLLRSPKHPLAVGDTIDLTGLQVTVTRATDDGRPAVARFRFDDPLDSKATEFLVWRGSGYEPFHPPPAGQTTHVDAVDLMRVTFGEDSPVSRLRGG